MPNRRRNQAQVAPVAPSAPQISGAVSGALEVRYEPIYDTLTLPAQAYTSIYNKFFLVPEGQSSKQKSDTNMTNAGMLAKPQSLICTAVRVEAFITDPADWSFLIKMMRDAYIDFTVGVKSYLKVPLESVMGKVKLDLGGTKNDGSAPKYYQTIGSIGKSGYKFPKEKLIKIGSNENFYVEFNSTVSHTLNSIAKLRIYLSGVKRLDVR